MRDSIRHEGTSRVKEYGYRRLVIGTKNGRRRIPNYAVLYHRVNSRSQRHRVEMGAEEERSTLCRGGYATKQIVAIASDRTASRVTNGVKAESDQMTLDGLDARSLLPAGTGN